MQEGEDMKIFIIVISFLIANMTLAMSDLELEGARWEAKSTGYLCRAYGEKVEKPQSYKNLNLNFELLRTDRSLDNGFILANYREGKADCRYSAILFADNDASTIELVKSHAYAIYGNSSCEKGKKLLDQQFEFNSYLYWGHPHHVTIMLPFENAEEICGENTTHIGLDFTVSGLIKNN